MMARRDPLKVARLREYIEESWLMRQKKALDHLRDIQNKASTVGIEKWSDRTVETAVNLKIAESVGAEIRARTTAETPRLFGMVMMQPRIEAHDAWEQMAAKEQAIEIPGQVVQRGIGIGPISGELGERVSLEPGTGDAATGTPEGTEPK